MKIKFLKDCKYEQNDAKNSREYKAGEVYDVDQDHARRWIRRQCAVEFVPEPPARPVRRPEAMVPATPVKGE
jgi:hypothetical protein